MPTRLCLRDGLPSGTPLRLVAVHAHPDDETLTTGLALAHHAHAGDDVHVITCTLGEEGEVITPELAHLEGADAALGEHRHLEVTRAMAALGVSHHYLGGHRPRWRDSGMAGSAAAAHPRAFAGADLEEAASTLADQLELLEPDLVLTYDPWGGYGHPDHIQTHRVTVRAMELLEGRSADRDRPSGPVLYVVLTPRSWAQEDRSWLAAHVPPGASSPTGARAMLPGPNDPFPRSVVDDALVTHAVSDEVALPRQVMALREHPTQVSVHDGWFTLSNDIAARLGGREGFARWPQARADLARVQGVPER